METLWFDRDIMSRYLEGARFGDDDVADGRRFPIRG
jgi:hypothetical protein